MSSFPTFNLTLIRPDLFIPLAEDSGLIIPMTKSLMHQVSNELVAFSQSLPPDFSVAFNISAKHCVNSELLEDSLEFLSSFPEKKVQLCLELTERELVRDTDEARALFHSLSEHDVSLAIDDFGTGHSSLSYLRQFRFDILKIDQSFVQMIGNDSVSAHIVENLLDLASRLSMKTIAEGVETAEQAEYLRSHNIDCLQGYYFAKPMPLKDFIQQLEQN
ncbi:EAL domain-containing protein [Vibrio campbellii]|uniref:EAL domain-containing protein n=1 Tax=Vibrio campbellii TaxID=680 RepID=UPI0020A51F58|nr:EAL domain-containing protein [Vibrio campbellii]